MIGKIITPPTYLQKIDGPIIFLAGPIQGAKNWQNEASKLIQLYDPQNMIIVANPRRDREMKGEFTQSKYDEQVDWESYHLKIAGNLDKRKGNGTILFWLAKENEHLCSRAYAQTTRFELAEWKMKHQIFGSKISVGIEDGFTGAKYVRRRMMQDCPEIKIFETLDATVMDAIRQTYDIGPR